MEQQRAPVYTSISLRIPQVVENFFTSLKILSSQEQFPYMVLLDYLLVSLFICCAFEYLLRLAKLVGGGGGERENQGTREVLWFHAHKNVLIFVPKIRKNIYK
jgi:hypothetical protein